MTPAPEFLDVLDSVEEKYFDTPQCRTLRRAADDYGGIDRLAQFMGSDASNVEHWYAGLELPPTAIYLTALDIVSQGPLRDIRVRVLP
ncbi:MAG TPA: hypothetical protein VE935_02040 [Burkholderiales bacterium]|jgi:hypothetical protein|nr:hypothetical protein [Burkholderiales bacterium]